MGGHSSNILFLVALFFIFVTTIVELCFATLMLTFRVLCLCNVNVPSTFSDRYLVCVCVMVGTTAYCQLLVKGLLIFSRNFKHVLSLYCPE